MNNRLRLTGRQFANDASGSVAVTFAAAFLMLLIVIGVVLDFGGASSLKTKLQITTDSAVLAGALNFQKTNDIKTATTEINTFLTDELPDARVVGAPVISSDKTSICITTTTNYNTFIMGMMGFKTLAVNSYACTKYDLKSFEITLVLDTSASMSGTDAAGKTKLQSMKDEATNFLNLLGKTAPGRVNFSTVPFSTTVNIGPQYRNAWFMDANGQSSSHFIEFSRPDGVQTGLVPTPSKTWAGSGTATLPWFPRSKFELFDGIGVSWAGCVMGRPVPYMTTDDAPSPASPDTMFVPFFWPDEADTGGTSSGVYNNYLKDSGITTKYIGKVSSSDMCAYKVNGQTIYQNADKSYANRYGSASSGAGPTPGQTMVCKYYGQQAAINFNSGYGSGYPVGPNLLCNPNKVATLTQDTATLISQINSYQAWGGTNIFSALMWGWRTISPNGPFRNGTGVSLPIEPKPYNYISPQNIKNNKIIILMSDGYNSETVYNTHSYRWLDWLGDSTMDSKTLEACANAKAAGVEIYTVGFYTSTADSASQSMLQKCATDTSHFYRAENGTQLSDAFTSIAKSISKLRRSQ